MSLQDVEQIDAGGVLDHLDGLQHVVVDLAGQRGRSFRGDDGEFVDAAHGGGDLLGDLRQHLDEHLQHRGLVVVRESGSPLVHGLRLGGTDGEGRGGLGLALGADGVGLRDAACLLGLAAARPFDCLGLSERGAALFLTLTGEACGLGLGLCVGDGGRLAGLGLEDLGVAPSLGRGFGLVPLRVCRFADLGVELAVLQSGLAHGHLLLLGEDGLIAVGLG